MGNFFNLNFYIMKEQKKEVKRFYKWMTEKVQSKWLNDNERMCRAFDIVVKQYEVL